MKNIIEPRTVSGFPEWLPKEKIREQELIDNIRQSYESFGFVPIDTPAVELNNILESKGEVSKQIYSLFRPNVPENVDSQTDYSLRFDLTVPLARYVAKHYSNLCFPFKRYQIQKVWRGERPQKGRFREFYQCDIDIIGNEKLDLLADAEIPLVICSCFEKMDIGDFIIRMSNRKILKGLMEYFDVNEHDCVEALRAIDTLPKQKQGMQAVNHILKEEIGIEDRLISILDFLFQEKGNGVSLFEKLESIGIHNETFNLGIKELRTVIDYMKALGINEKSFEVDLSITRGLDYYTGTVFETFLINHEKWSVCSGGRYDDLASRFIKKKLPGVGMSIGLTRLFDYLLEHSLIKTDHVGTSDVMVAVVDRKENLESCLSVANLLRRHGIKTELYTLDVKLDKQLRYADRNNIPLVVVPWRDLISSYDAVEIKDMVTGCSEKIKCDSLVHEVRKHINFLEKKNLYEHH